MWCSELQRPGHSVRTWHDGQTSMKKKSQSQRPWWRIAGKVVAVQVKCLAQRKEPLRGNLNPHTARSSSVHTSHHADLVMHVKKKKNTSCCLHLRLFRPGNMVTPFQSVSIAAQVHMASEGERALVRQCSRPPNPNLVKKKKHYEAPKSERPLQHRVTDREGREKKGAKDKKVETWVDTCRSSIFLIKAAASRGQIGGWEELAAGTPQGLFPPTMTFDTAGQSSHLNT